MPIPNHVLPSEWRCEDTSCSGTRTLERLASISLNVEPPGSKLSNKKLAALECPVCGGRLLSVDPIDRVDIFVAERNQLGLFVLLFGAHEDNIDPTKQFLIAGFESEIDSEKPLRIVAGTDIDSMLNEMAFYLNGGAPPFNGSARVNSDHSAFYQWAVFEDRRMSRGLLKLIELNGEYRYHGAVVHTPQECLARFGLERT